MIVGDVPYKDRYANAIRRQAADARIVFTGYVTDRDELSALYQQCHVYFHGHEFGGTNPALLQALAAGCAVCALDTVFNREMLLDGEYGLFFSKERGNLEKMIAELEMREERARRFPPESPRADPRKLFLGKDHRPIPALVRRFGGRGTMQTRNQSRKYLKNGGDILLLILSFLTGAFLAKRHAGLAAGFFRLGAMGDLFPVLSSPELEYRRQDRSGFTMNSASGRSPRT